jgi:hypothetical protein
MTESGGKVMNLKVALAELLQVEERALHVV